ncbi:hypothetical protein PF006_g18158 [Phytophthora fragariae]|uniref:Uncharacterized protein n=1 Tax=Phytophthora fragariae TaxID=53985 RepID=A0A6A3SXW7_9STRA|nr:hypothetical protein PF006_g18158 [Phytophthora fragariae]
MPKKKTKPPNPRQSSARAAGKRSGAPSSPSTEPPKRKRVTATGRKRVTATGRELVGPDVWYSSAVADSLPMPPRSTLVAVVKPRRRRAIKRTKAKLRKRKRKRKLRKEPRGECGGCRSSTRIPAWAMRAKLSRRKRSNGHIARPSLDHREARLKSPCGGAAHHLPPPNALH